VNGEPCACPLWALAVCFGAVCLFLAAVLWLSAEVVRTILVTRRLRAERVRAETAAAEQLRRLCNKLSRG
jgi:hypothetical protein